jgi:hypothetical protein
MRSREEIEAVSVRPVRLTTVIVTAFPWMETFRIVRPRFVVRVIGAAIARVVRSSAPIAIVVCVSRL